MGVGTAGGPFLLLAWLGLDLAERTDLESVHWGGDDPERNRTAGVLEPPPGSQWWGGARCEGLCLDLWVVVVRLLTTTLTAAHTLPRPRPLVSEWTRDRSSVPLGGMGGMGLGAGSIPALLTLGPLRGARPGG